MNQKEILEKIKEIKEELEKDQFNIIREKILERRFHLHKSKRYFFIRKLIQKIRKRLILEIGLILHPVLKNQEEINLRFLNEIEQLKESYSSHELNQQKNENEKKSPKPFSKDQK